MWSCSVNSITWSHKVVLSVASWATNRLTLSQNCLWSVLCWRPSYIAVETTRLAGIHLLVRRRTRFSWQTVWFRFPLSWLALKYVWIYCLDFILTPQVTQIRHFLALLQIDSFSEQYMKGHSLDALASLTADRYVLLCCSSFNDS